MEDGKRVDDIVWETRSMADKIFVLSGEVKEIAGSVKTTRGILSVVLAVLLAACIGVFIDVAKSALSSAIDAPKKRPPEMTLYTPHNPLTEILVRKG